MRIFLVMGVFAQLVLNIQKVDAKPCVFCKETVIEKQSVFQDDYFHVLMDYEPRVRGHLLVIPKRHLEKAHQLSKEEWQELLTVISKVAGFFTEVLHTDQYIILEKNAARSSFQEVPHIHFHLLPVTSETWAEIFNIVPKRLTQEELKEEVSLFRSCFSA